MVHGGGADTSHLAPQFYFLAQYGTVLNIDLRGYGKSDKTPTYGTIEQYAQFSWNLLAPERLKACKLPILYIEDEGGTFSDLGLFAQICPQLRTGKTVGSGHFPTLEVPEQVNGMIHRFVITLSGA